VPLLEKALSISPLFTPALADRAVAYFVGGEYDMAERALRELERVDPTHATVQQLRQAMAGAEAHGVGGGGGGGGKGAASGEVGSVHSGAGFGDSDTTWKNNRMMKKAPDSEL
jgi:Tetratricopeptide repeat